VAARRGGPRTDSIGDACDSEAGGSDTVANGQFFTTLTMSARCIGGTDVDGDGYCSTGAANIIDPSDANSALVPESYHLVQVMALAHSGSALPPSAPTSRRR